MRARGLITALVVAAAGLGGLGSIGAAGLASSGAGGAAGRSRPELRVLVFTKTTGFRHDLSIAAGVDAIRRLGQRHRFAVTHTEDATRFTARNLARYDAVIFLSASGDPLDRPEQKRAFRRYIERGGGFLGIHAAADTPHTWRWYEGLIGARFTGHPPGLPVEVVRVLRRRNAATRGLPAAWRRMDEWYRFRFGRRARLRVLATVDGRPIAWCHRYDGGRSVYTAMGHTSESFAEPLVNTHLLGSIRLAAGAARFDCAPG